MRIRRMTLVLTAGLLLLTLCGCGAGKKTENQSYTSLADLEDKRIGVTTGSVQAMQAEERRNRCGCACTLLQRIRL